ncbi:hypothetical protein L596_019655 [Steinernema carpocapsae]|uniref:Uncharacterized protein n=1 Tax=Steinernema carpocapsae TaxID=34508 RepID=A0A4U5MS02_STECR|nr:hypothetical protein L596_019655 [Steinernema carpocapsae]
MSPLLTLPCGRQRLQTEISYLWIRRRPTDHGCSCPFLDSPPPVSPMSIKMCLFPRIGCFRGKVRKVSVSPDAYAADDDDDDLPKSKKKLFRFCALFRQMHFLPQREHRSPNSITKSLREELLLFQTDIKPHDKIQEVIARYLEEAKHLICDHDAVYYQMRENNNPVIELAEEFCYDDLWSLIVTHLPKLAFESKKDVGLIFVNLLERKIGSRSPMAEYLIERPEILVALIKGYESPDHETALVCGQMLRECVRFEMLVKYVLYSRHFFSFFEYVNSPCFEVQSDALNTFRQYLTVYKPLVARFLYEHYIEFFDCYTELIKSENYITRRQSLKLLGDLLLDSHNQDTTDKYIESAEHLRDIIHVLKDHSHIIELEAFNVLKLKIDFRFS